MQRTIMRFLWSAAVSFLLTFNPLGAGQSLAEPGAQSFFRAYALGNGITLRWNDPTEIDGTLTQQVSVWRSAIDYPDNSPVDETEVYNGTDRFFTDSGLTVSTTYYYTIYGYDSSSLVHLDAYGLSGDETRTATTPHGGTTMIFMQNPVTGYVSKWVINAIGQREWGGLVNETPMSPGWWVVGAADLNGDGNHDLVLENPDTGYVSKWLLSVDGFRRSGGLIHDAPMSPGWRVAGMGDINGDGFDDLVLENQDAGKVAKWLLDNPGIRVSGGLINYPLNTEQRIAVVTGLSDYNDVGFDEIVIESLDTGAVSACWYAHSASSSISAGVVNWDHNMSPGWEVACAADLTGDGTDDLVLQNPDTGLVSKYLIADNIWDRESGGLIHTSPMSPGWRVAGAADLNGDGIDDLVLENPNTGYVSKWLLNDSGERVSGGLIHQSPMSPDWEICAIVSQAPLT